ncbi:MAG TPA: C1 family peptidase [Paucimonas sp.]|nr:C1 family peptidase [Paucimonas sp.]HJW54340.1 C1 family peptidase [Burkholderiaceae bacterium]
MSTSALQSRVDLRIYDIEIEDQGAIGSCTANATCSAIELMMSRAHDQVDLSRLFLYYETRALEDRIGKDGAIPVDAFKAGFNVGIPEESLWDYNIGNTDTQPSNASYANAATQKITSFHSVGLDPDSTQVTTQNIKAELSKGLPVTVAFRAYEWMLHISGPMDSHDIINTSIPGYANFIGNHEVVIVGYDDALNGGSFIIENSWGTAWGENGYGAFSYTLSNTFYEAYVIDGFAGHDFAWTTARTQVAELYAALFGRAPERDGMAYWAAQLDVGKAFTQVAQEMYSVDAARAWYPSGASNEKIIDTFYVNVLGRNADADGLAYWLAQLNAGHSQGQVMTELITAVDSYTGSNSAALASQLLFDNKVAVGLHYAVTLEANRLDVAATAFDGMTTDVNQVELIKIGLSEQLGWL